MKTAPIWFFVCALVLSACGSSSDSNSKIKIGCAAPLTGDQAQIGIDMCNGVELALLQANDFAQQAAVSGVAPLQFEISRQDDQHNPAQAVNVAKKFVSDPAVLAVVGHFNSSCTKPSSAVYNSAGLTQITPASTNPELSRQGFSTFFRTAATDEVQGPKGAIFAVKKLGIKKIFVIDDKTTYGKGLADEFEKKARELGAEILGHEGITQGDKDFTPLLTKIKPLEPELIYYGGIYPEGSLLLRQTRALDMKAGFMGGDGIATLTFSELATQAIAEGTYATMVGGDMHQVPAAASFIRDYESKYGTLGQWSAYGYDSANVFVETIRKAATKDRAAVLKTIREIPKFQGITGDIVFDEKGDNQNQFIGIFQFQSGKLHYVGPAD
ncbi:MAG TPA: branched-chain amino acid ABC transporter substrate-binding protein [Candidatus Omnitrophota bacterium]|nr:branched chain amino acid ABC transporter substrate-binding protein [Candidatus Omnitrophota bacterium]HRK60958.1 branched-chain amino acid ABC transporter substrate-binding protein [Candidatus Omnitrophota bacterium]